MIGKYVKRLWQNWPSKETKIRAEDLNKYENTLKEHDDRLAELDGIEKKIKENKDGIQGLQDMSQAGTYANNSVIITKEAKQIGTFLDPGMKIYQKGYRIIDSNNTNNGTVYIQDAFIANDGMYVRHLVDVKCFVRTGDQWRQYSMPGHGDVVIEHYYIPVHNTLMIDYKGLGTSQKIFNIIVQYTEETA